MLNDDLKAMLIERLKKIDSSKVILFGSHAYGEPGPGSDIDLLVVTEDDFLPGSFAEKNAVYLKVADSIGDIRKLVSIDLIVHTKAMHHKFIELNSMFSRKVIAEGKVLYEKAH